jgi:hypothetical protein
MDPYELVDALREGLERRDADRVSAVLHQDVELHLYSSPDVITGREAAREWYRQAFSSRTVFEGEAVPEPGEDGALVARGRVRWYDHGVLRDWPGRWRITFRDGLIATITAERDTDSADAGSSPP